jgi:NAD(P)-dependent dehydrogenase (short-subunit alcohol dehydrogenase family)
MTSTRIVSVNITGVVQMCQAALPHLAQPGGVIVNISSALALGACSGFTAYSASKAAVIGLTQSLAAEIAPRGQRVVAVAPAIVLTPMTRQHLVGSSVEDWQKTQDCHPLGIGIPDDVAAAVAFLASNERGGSLASRCHSAGTPRSPAHFAVHQAVTCRTACDALRARHSSSRLWN